MSYRSTARYASQGGAAVQVHRFPSGGFVLHRVNVPGASVNVRFSAWFDTDGALIDAERKQGTRCTPVKTDSKAWAHLSGLGAVYKTLPAPSAPVYREVVRPFWGDATGIESVPLERLNAGTRDKGRAPDGFGTYRNLPDGTQEHIADFHTFAEAAASVELSCRWFAGCLSPAIDTTAHPVLGAVPVCAKCKAFAEG